MFSMPMGRYHSDQDVLCLFRRATKSKRQHQHAFPPWMQTFTCKRRGGEKKKAIKTTNSWSFCASVRCCEIFPRSSSRALQGNGGSCSARSPSCFCLCRARGTSIPSDCSNRTDRNTPLQRRPISRCLSPFGTGPQQQQQLLSPTGASERVNK